MALPEKNIDAGFKYTTKRFYNGKTYINENKEKKEKIIFGNRVKEYTQYQTQVNDKNGNFIIYDEIINIDNKRNKMSVFITRIEEQQTLDLEILEKIIYFQNNEVVTQIRKIPKKQYQEEVNNNQDLIKEIEDDNTVIFSENPIDIDRNQETIKPLWKKILWETLKVAVIAAAWIAIPLFVGLVFIPWLSPVIGAAVLTWLPGVLAGGVVGTVVTVFNKYKTQLRKKIFPKWKSKAERKAELNKLEKEWEKNHNQNVLDLSANMREDFEIKQAAIKAVNEEKTESANITEQVTADTQTELETDTTAIEAIEHAPFDSDQKPLINATLANNSKLEEAQSNRNAAS